MGRKNNTTRAFTLVELLISLSVIAILSMLAIMYFRGQAHKGNDARRKSDIQRIKVAVEEYEKDHNCYPTYVTCGVNQNQPVYPYLNNVPCDPMTNASYFYVHSGNDCPGWYQLFSNLQFEQDPDTISGIGPGSAFNYVSGSANSPVLTPSPISTGDSSEDSGEETIGGETVVESTYYGCQSGACVPIGWNPDRPGPACDPNFQFSSCYGACLNSEGQPINECIEI